jgi:aerobic carbon-monoxide dehydrogenase medium subunit
MYPAQFDYLRPSTLDEAVALLAEHGDAAKLLAGGHSLIPAMKLRLARPEVVIDIGRIPALDHIRDAGTHFVIGALVTHQEIAASSLLRAESPLLPETASHIGDVQVRNRGTIGGSLAHADPAADYPAAILALDADIVVTGPSGQRVIRAGQFFVDLLQTAVAANEIITEIRVPKTSPAVAYEKTEQKASGFALCGVAAIVASEGIRVAVTGVAAKAYRAAAVERALTAPPLKAEAIARAASHAADGVEPLADIHASAEFRAHLAKVNTRRALERALARA